MPSIDPQIVDLNKELLLRIGNPSDEHVISWDILKNVGNTLEALILSLAKHSGEIDNNKVSLEEFKLDFSGFYNGSAVPAFKLNTHPIPALFNTAKAKRAIVEDFSNILQYIDKGNYKAIADQYPQVEAKNDVLKRVYDFTNSAGTKPVSVVKRVGNNEFSNIYKVRKLKKGVLNQLIVKDNILPETEVEESTAVAKMIVTNKNGKISQKASVVYNDKEATLSLKIDHIGYLDKRYNFRVPVLFQIYQEGGGTIIENEQLDIYASGKDITEAKIQLYSQFDHSYKRLNELGDQQLSNRLSLVKQYFNSIIKSVINI